MYIIVQNKTIIKNLKDCEFNIDNLDQYHTYYHISSFKEYYNNNVYHPDHDSFYKMQQILFEEEDNNKKESIDITLEIITKKDEEIIKNIEYKLTFKYDGNNEQKAYKMQQELWTLKALMPKTARQLNTFPELLIITGSSNEYDKEFEYIETFEILRNDCITLNCMTSMFHNFFKMFEKTNFNIVRVKV